MIISTLHTRYDQNRRQSSFLMGAEARARGRGGIGLVARAAGTRATGDHATGALRLKKTWFAAGLAGDAGEEDVDEPAGEVAVDVPAGE